MSKDEEPINPTAARAIKGGLLAAGAALAPSNPAVGALIVGVAELTGPGAGGVGVALQGFKERILSKTGRNLKQRIEEEKIDPDPEQMDYLFAQAVPYVANATTEQKRQMMEEVLLNGARRSKEAAAQIEAKQALHWIEGMQEESALVFSLILAKLNQIPPDKPQILPLPLPSCNLPDFLAERAQSDLQTRRFIEYVFERDFEQPAGYYKLSQHGAWLAEWITNNPTQKEEHPQP